MTADQMVQAIKSHRGKIKVRADFAGTAVFLHVPKPELISHFESRGGEETGVDLIVTGKGRAIIDAWA